MRRRSLPGSWPRLVESADGLPPCVSLPSASRRPSASIHPRVYGAAGLDISAAKSEARANPRWRATKTWAARKVMAEFEELGLLNAAPARWIYRRGGLLPPAT